MKRTSLFLLFTIFFMLHEYAGFCQPVKLDKNDLETTMRNPWVADRAQYLQHWLLLGTIPAKWDDGLDTDFLLKDGGEATMNPIEGQTIKLADGTECKWKTLQNPSPIINLVDFFKGLPTENVVCYAYGVIHRPNAGKALLTLGSDDAVKVWLNGKEIHRNHVYRGVAMDQDLLDVDLNQGDNFLLLKILQGSGGWAFTSRLIADTNVVVNTLQKPKVSLIDKPMDSTFTIRSVPLLKTFMDPQSIRINIYGSDGKTGIEKTILCGDSVVVDYSKWADGVYEIKYQYADLAGLHSSEYRTWVKGDVLALAQALVKSSPGKNATSMVDITHRMLADFVTDRLGGNLTNPDPNKFYLLHPLLMEYAEMITDNQIRPGGFIRLAYVDDIDGTPQFCRCYIPSNYDPAKKSAMVVFLHGYNGDNPNYIHWWSADKRHDPYVDRYNYILIEPHGRGNTQYFGIGDKDVMTCIRMAKEKLNIDENRVYLTGESMGGGGTWRIATVHPELFAAIAPVYGGWDHHNTMTKDELKKRSDIADYLLDKANSTCQFEALLNMPILALHGDNDKTVNVDNTRYLVRMLQRWGYDIRYIEVPGKGHEFLGKSDVIYPWLLQHTRNSNPKQVRVRAADLRTASAYWVRVTQRSNGFKVMNVEAEILSNNLIQINSDNVLEIVLSPDKTLIQPDRPVKVIWNGELFTVEPNAYQQIKLHQKDLDLQKNHKIPALAGPINDFINTPFAVVIGTISTDSLMRKVVRSKVEAFSSYWVNWQKFKPRIFYDTAISDADLKEYSLFLFGGPKENKIAERIAKSLPFAIDSNSISIQGQGFAAEKACLEAVYPSPFNAMRYIRLVAPTSFEGMFFYNPVMTTYASFDYVIVDGKIANPAITEAEKKMGVVTGIFDYNWKLDTSCLFRDDGKQDSVTRRVVNKKLRVEILSSVKPSAELLNAYAGSYKVEQAEIPFQFIVEDAKPYIQMSNNMKYDAKALSNSEFFVDGLNLVLSFQKDTAGKDYFITLYQGSYRMKCNKTTL